MDFCINFYLFKYLFWFIQITGQMWYRVMIEIDSFHGKMSGFSARFKDGGLSIMQSNLSLCSRRLVICIVWNKAPSLLAFM